MILQRESIAREERLQKLGEDLALPVNTPVRGGGEDNEDTSKEYREAFFEGVKRGFDKIGHEQMRVLQVGVNTDGGLFGS